MEGIFLSLYLLRFAGVSPGKRQHSPEKKSPEWFGRERGLSQIGGFAVPRAARKLDLSKALFDLGLLEVHDTWPSTLPAYHPLEERETRTSGSLPHLYRAAFQFGGRTQGQDCSPSSINLATAEEQNPSRLSRTDILISLHPYPCSRRWRTF